MSRNIPPLLKDHLEGVGTTTTRLLKITTKDGFSYGMAMLDRDVEYNDGGGEILYVAANGFDPATLSADVGYSVANTEGYSLISNTIDGITAEDVELGRLDDAEWICYLVNFEDLSMGHVILDAGDVGEVRVRYGLVWIPELLSYIMRLRQSVGHVWSRTCRATFGSPPNSPTGCGVDLGPLWVYGEVLTVGAEGNRVFTGDNVTDSPSPIPAPGRIQFLTGANAGKEFTVEEVNDGTEVTLNETTVYPLAVGDEYRIRPDCRKRFVEDCIDTWDNGPNFKGEPTIPVGDSVGVQTPGAQQGRGSGFISTRTTVNPGGGG